MGTLIPGFDVSGGPAPADAAEWEAFAFFVQALLAVPLLTLFDTVIVQTFELTLRTSHRCSIDLVLDWTIRGFSSGAPGFLREHISGWAESLSAVALLQSFEFVAVREVRVIV